MCIRDSDYIVKQKEIDASVLTSSDALEKKLEIAFEQFGKLKKMIIYIL